MTCSYQMSSQYPNIFPRLLRFFVHQLKWNAERTTTDTSSSTPNNTQVGINRVMDSTATQRVTKILYDNATTNIKDNLEVPPPDRLQYISRELKLIFGKSTEYDQFKTAFTDSVKLFDAVKKLSNTEAWKDRATIEKIRDIWDIVQTYEHKGTYSPQRAIEARAFECALKSYISGLLIRQYIPEAQVEFWRNHAHAKLMIQDDKKIYSYDAAVSMSDDFDRHIGVTDRSVVIQPSYREIGLDPLSEVAGRRFFSTHQDKYGILPGAEGHYLITDFDKGAVAAIFGNLASLITDRPTQLNIYKRVLELTPNDPTACNNVAALTVDVPEKIRFFRKTIELDPTFALAYSNLADLTEDPDEKRRLYRKVIELRPDFAEAYYNLAVIAVDPEEKRRLYRKVIELNPDSAVAQFNLASVTEDPEEQARLYRKAIELRPDFAEAYYNLAKISDLPEKIELFRKALMLKPLLREYLRLYAYFDTDGELKTALTRLLAEFP